ncbi:MAG TPA: winged helix-turn-helix domain-containing protein [Acidisphaera sp.]|nr:winged helix-turn-helix domain-containing protein [Acidisphaera sp.]
MSISADRDHAVLFGPFRLLPAQRLLLEGDRAVRLGSRALDLLIALIGRAGETVTKSELAATVWPGVQVVGEGTIRVHVLELRKALGDGQDGRRYVSTIAGRGYCFVGPVTRASDKASPLAPPQPPAFRRERRLPTLPTRVIGRDSALATVASQLTQSRLVTVAGAGGIGKTTLALAVAESAASAHAGGVWFVDLARIREPSLVPSAVATALGIAVGSADPTERLLAFARDHQMLVLIDNCEHVIDAAASIASQLVRDTSDVHVLATSREQLRVRGERVYRLGGLDSPAAGAGITADEALAYAAVQLFVERAAACVAGFELTDCTAPIVAEICRRLDGIALAIELAAARVEEFGARGLAAGLDDRFRLLSRGSRTATDRHRTLRGALDWSYQLLTQEEQRIFRRLAVFAGGFTLQAACAVAAGSGDESEDVPEIVASLVVKSLAATDLCDGDVRFRLLETTRAYALAKLVESGEAAAIGRRHSVYYRDLMEASLDDPSQGDLATAYRPEIDNIRAALAWAFSPAGDTSIAVDLAAGSAPVWLDMSLLAECRTWSEKALAALDATDRGTRRELVLQTELGLTLMFTRGMSDQARVALTRAFELAERIDDVDYRLRALTALANFLIRVGDLQGALALGRRAEAIGAASDDPVALSTADWILAASLFLLGDYAPALTHAQRPQRRTIPHFRRTHFARWELEDSVTARVVVAHTWWTQGRLDQAACAARDLVADTQASGHPFSVCLALLWCGCGISLLLGDFETAERSIARLKDHAERNALNAFLAHGAGFKGLLSLKRGQTEPGIRLLRMCLDGLRRAQSEVLYVLYLGGLAEGLAAAGDVGGSIAAADEALQRVARNHEMWLMPETQRITGEVLLARGTAGAAEAEDLFRQALSLAHRQGALSWELRSAMSLGRLYHANGRSREACGLLAPIYDRFSEGLQTADLQCAGRMLQEWSESAGMRATGTRTGRVVSRSAAQVGSVP